MELNKYQINRIRAGVIEEVADYLITKLDSARDTLKEQQTELQELLQHEEDLRSWELPDKKESVKRAELYVSTWQMLLEQLDKSLIKEGRN